MSKINADRYIGGLYHLQVPKFWFVCLFYTFSKRLFYLNSRGEVEKSNKPTHWEDLLQSVSDFIFSKHYGYRCRGFRGVKRSEKLWEIQNYPLSGRPFIHHWVKSKTICHFLRNFDAFLNGFFILLNFGWMVDLAMSIFEFLTKFLVFWHSWHPWVCIRSVCWK